MQNNEPNLKYVVIKSNGRKFDGMLESVFNHWLENDK